jgi:pimeloyl-ACP methyl ester carboxylesterase
VDFRHHFNRLSARTLDAAMCGMMYAIQRRHRLDSTSREVLARYIDTCAPLSRDEYFRHAPAEITVASGSQPLELTWTSPITSGYAENDRAFALHFPAPGRPDAPTVFFLHALMSASDIGYRRWAARFNASGWSACFVHLPYHYSRVPRGHRNGELAITANLVRNAEGLRQGVTELRQLMAWLRAKGVKEFGVWGCSYGGWIGALLASVERDFRFVALMEPIVDVGHAIWQSLTGLALRRELRRIGIEPELPARHFPLTSPLHGQPLCGADRVLLAAGEYDTIARAEDVAALQARWAGSTMITEPQGHFGYRLMPAAWDWLESKGWLETSEITSNTRETSNIQ